MYCGRTRLCARRRNGLIIQSLTALHGGNDDEQLLFGEICGGSTVEEVVVPQLNVLRVMPCIQHSMFEDRHGEAV